MTWVDQVTLEDSGSQAAPTETFDYDARGNLIQGTDASGARKQYQYDLANRKILELDETDLVAETGLQPYDYLALVPVIEAAGGIITDWDGAALTLGSDGRVLAAATADLHGAALAILRDRDI